MHDGKRSTDRPDEMQYMYVHIREEMQCICVESMNAKLTNSETTHNIGACTHIHLIYISVG